MKPKLIVYLPVIHQGYLQFFKKYNNADIFIINSSLIDLIDLEFDYLRKEIRAISPQQAEISLSSLLPNRNISLIGVNDLMLLDKTDQTIILPKEDIFSWLAKKYLPKSHVVFEATFLRWNKDNVLSEKKVSTNSDSSAKNKFKKLLKLVEKADSASQPSSDWWRQVGAIIFDSSGSKKTESKIIAIAHNQHLPSPYTPYIDSDPRNVFHKGENIDLSTAIHAEAALIANCAKSGTSLEGKSIYVSTFPCPVCAKQIAVSGISQLFYRQGYSILDGERVLNNAGVKIVKVVDLKSLL